MVDQSAAPVATTHQELTLDLNADVAEWCPAPSSARRLLAAGTYQLNEATQQREGRLYFYRLKGEIVRNDQSLSLDPASTTDIPGIFDLRWRPDAAQPTLAAALADGSLRIMNVDATESGGDVVVEEVGRAESPDGGMALSVEWQRRGGAEPQLTSSYSDGLVAVHQATPSGLSLVHSWTAHDLEAWTASFHDWTPGLVLSGGDDCAFKGWDVREDTPTAALWIDRKSHGAGVCCIASSPYQEHIVATGSYDESARVWDIRATARPVAVAEVPTGGGVWRLKWHPTDPQLMLGACMHGGFAVLRANSESGSGERGIDVAERYPHQVTLAYGAGWCAEVGEDGTSVAATASFYDRLFHVWSPGMAAQAVGS